MSLLYSATGKVWCSDPLYPPTFCLASRTCKGQASSHPTSEKTSTEENLVGSDLDSNSDESDWDIENSDGENMLHILKCAPSLNWSMLIIHSISDEQDKSLASEILDISDEEEEVSQTAQMPKKKPKRSTQEKEESKRNRNLGLEYIDSNGNPHKARARKPVKECKRRKCQDIITDEIGDTIFQEYWSQGSYDKRKAYITSRIEYDNVPRKRKRDPDSTKSKEVSWKYFLEVRGARHQVCKDTFLNTLDESDTFIRTCAKHKRDTVTGLVSEDRRGKNKPKHSLDPATVQQVIHHIHSFPAMNHITAENSLSRNILHGLLVKVSC